MRKNLFGLSLLSFIFILSGCTVRTYQMTKDRVDQDLNMGNRGYIAGASSEEPAERKTTRTIRAVEIELSSPVKFEKSPKTKPMSEAQYTRTEDVETWGNRGYITETSTPSVLTPDARQVSMEKYTVQKGDTLQKISQKYFGSTKKWLKVYDANKDTLTGPNKIYPGQVINIPVEPLKETKENLK